MFLIDFGTPGKAGGGFAKKDFTGANFNGNVITAINNANSAVITVTAVIITVIAITVIAIIISTFIIIAAIIAIFRLSPILVTSTSKQQRFACFPNGFPSGLPALNAKLLRYATPKLPEQVMSNLARRRLSSFIYERLQACIRTKTRPCHSFVVSSATWTEIEAVERSNCFTY